MPVLDRFPGTTLHLGQGRPPRPCHIRLQGNAATIGAPAILLKDSRPQANLKLHRPSSLDYSARHGRPVQVEITCFMNMVIGMHRGPLASSL